MTAGGRALQQFAQEAVQGNSISATSIAVKTPQDGSLVCSLEFPLDTCEIVLTTRCPQTNCHFYFFLNNPVKQWPILLIFGVQLHEETR